MINYLLQQAKQHDSIGQELHDELQQAHENVEIKHALDRHDWDTNRLIRSLYPQKQNGQESVCDEEDREDDGPVFKKIKHDDSDSDEDKGGTAESVSEEGPQKCPGKIDIAQ